MRDGMPQAVSRMLQGFRRATAGVAAVELGLATPFLLVLLVGTMEIGAAMYEATQVYSAVEAGMVYTAKYGWDQNGISSAVANASRATGLAASPAPRQFCGCPDSSGIGEILCTSTCAGGIAPGQYVEIGASIPHTTILPYPGFGLPTTLTARSLIRLY
jgi:hypothetical protein